MSQQVIRRSGQLIGSAGLISITTTPHQDPNTIRNTEIDDVARVVFGSTSDATSQHQSSGGQQSNQAVTQVAEPKLAVHGDPSINNDILRLGAKLAKNANIQTGLLQELSHDWSMLANPSVQSQLLTQSTTLSGGTPVPPDFDNSPPPQPTGSLNESGVGQAPHRFHSSVGSGSEVSPTNTRLSDWSSDESFDHYIEIEDTELAQSFSSLRRAISNASAQHTPTMERHNSNRSAQSVDVISEEQFDDDSDVNVYDEVHGWSATGSHITLHIPPTARQTSLPPLITTPPTPAQRERSASNFEDALRELQLPASAEDAGEHGSEDSNVVSKLMKWLKARVFGDEDDDELADSHQQSTDSQHARPQLQQQSSDKQSTHPTLSVLQRIQAKTAEMQAAHSNNTYLNSALGVAAIIIALVLCKRYSPVLYERLVRMLHRTAIPPT